MTQTAPTPPPAGAQASALGALHTLLAGNRRFVEGRSDHAALDPEARAQLVEGQDPIAVLLGCVDSRVPPEIVLDSGLGDLLTVRTAGQSLAGVALGSIEFGVRVLGIPLVVVLGHSQCGAVLAAMDEHQPDGHLGALTGEVAGRLVDVLGEDPIHATAANVAATVAALRSLDTLRAPEGHAPFVVGLHYDLASGRVQVTDDAGLFGEAGPPAG